MAYGTVAVTPGVGAGIAVDAIGGSQFQRVKLGWGPQGTLNEVDTPTPLPMVPYVGATAVGATAGLPVSFQVPGQAGSQLVRAKIDHAANGDNAIVAGVAAQTIRIHRMFFKCDGAVNIKILDGAGGTALTGTMIFYAGEMWTLDFDGEPWFESAVAGAFVINLSAAVGIRGRVYYKQS